jgi:hypothetical protein
MVYPIIYRVSTCFNHPKLVVTAVAPPERRGSARRVAVGPGGAAMVEMEETVARRCQLASDIGDGGFQYMDIIM